MKHLLLSIPLLFLLPSCMDSHASSEHAAERPPENGAQFKKGEGLSLTDEMAKAIDLKVAEVTEEKIAAQLNISLRPIPGTKEASGWLTADQAAKVGNNATFILATEPKQQAQVIRVEKAPFHGAGDYEVTVSAEQPLTDASSISATMSLPVGEAVSTIPPSALLTTAEGHFVYARNGKFYVRTPVKVGLSNVDHVEVLDGLYSGDEVVTSPVMSLWMAELQVLRGGKACTCGH